MRWVAMLVVVSGCNQLFDLAPTDLNESSVDAPPPACPAIGTAPTFSGELRQLPAKGCLAYTPSLTTGTAVATCRDAGTYAGFVASGLIDAELAAVALAPDPGPGLEPRLSPEGDQFIVATYSYTTYEYKLLDYRLDATGAWSMGRETKIPSTSTVSTPSRGPDRRMLLVEWDISYVASLVEYSDVSGAWTEVRRYSYEELGITNSLMQPSLSSDGLRLVFVQYNEQITPQGGFGETGGGGGGGTGGEPAGSGMTAYYTDRPTKDSRFGKVQELTTVPTGIEWPHLSDDCGRIYFSALDTVFYLRQ